jgi:hypothetical protein
VVFNEAMESVPMGVGDSGEVFFGDVLEVEQDPGRGAVAEEKVGGSECGEWIVTANPEDAAKEVFGPRNWVECTSCIDPCANASGLEAGLKELFEQERGCAEIPTKLGYFSETESLGGPVPCRNASGEGFSYGRGRWMVSGIPLRTCAAEAFVEHGAKIGEKGRAHDEES